MSVSIMYDSPAYIEERFAIHVDVKNNDQVEVEIFLDVLVQPGEDDSREWLLYIYIIWLRLT